MWLALLGSNEPMEVSSALYLYSLISSEKELTAYLVECSGIAVDGGSGCVLGRGELRFDLIVHISHLPHLHQALLELNLKRFTLRFTNNQSFVYMSKLVQCFKSLCCIFVEN